MKQMMQMFLLDVKMNVKDMMGVYVAVVPVAILLVLRLFLPSVENTQATIAAVTEGRYAVESSAIALLDQYFDVQAYPTIEAMEQKLRGVGSAEGLYWDPDEGQYVSVLERSKVDNTVFSLAARILRPRYQQLNYPDAPPMTTFDAGVPAELADRTKASPVATLGGAIFLVYMGMIMAYVIGLGIVHDKENGTDVAIRVSPVSKLDYFVGKSIYPLILTAVYAVVSLVLLDLLHVDVLQVYVGAVLGFVLTMFLGLLIGALAKNENEAVGIVKAMGMVIVVALLGATMLPENWHWILYWAPFFWAFDIFQGIFQQSLTWGALAWKGALMIGLTAIFFLTLRRRMAAGLT